MVDDLQMYEYDIKINILILKVFAYFTNCNETF